MGYSKSNMSMYLSLYLCQVFRVAFWRSKPDAHNCAQRMRLQTTGSNPMSGSIIYPYVRLSGRPRAFLRFLYLYVYPSVCTSVCPSVHTSFLPSVCLSVCPYVRLSICPSVHSSIRPSVRLSVHPSFRPSCSIPCILQLLEVAS